MHVSFLIITTLQYYSHTKPGVCKLLYKQPSVCYSQVDPRELFLLLFALEVNSVANGNAMKIQYIDRTIFPVKYFMT